MAMLTIHIFGKSEGCTKCSALKRKVASVIGEDDTTEEIREILSLALRICEFEGGISKANARVIERATSMCSLLEQVRYYLSKLRFDEMDMQLTNECWINLIEKELGKVRGDEWRKGDIL